MRCDMQKMAARLVLPGLALIVCVNLAASQVVKLNETPLAPYKTAPDDAARQSAAPSAYFYVAVRPGPTGTLSAGKESQTLTKSSGFVYPSVDFVFSAASRLIADGSTANNADSATKALAEVSRINAHVRIDALDNARNTFKGF